MTNDWRGANAGNGGASLGPTNIVPGRDAPNTQVPIQPVSPIWQHGQRNVLGYGGQRGFLPPRF